MNPVRGEVLCDLLSRSVASDEAAVRIPLLVAGVRFDIITKAPAVAAWLNSYFKSYRHENGGATLAEIYVEPIESSPELDDLWFDPDPEFHLNAENGFVVQRDFAAGVFARSLEGTERVLAFLSPSYISDAVCNLLRWWLPPKLIKHDAFLLHGAGVIHGNQGYVFFGESGAGKSTAIRLIASHLPEAEILGDDSVIAGIPRHDSVPWVYSAPLGSTYSREPPSASSAPLGGLFSLRKQDKHVVESLPISAGVTALLGSIMGIGFGINEGAAMDLAVRMAKSRCGISRLCFRRDPGFWMHVIQSGYGMQGRSDEYKKNF